MQTDIYQVEFNNHYGYFQELGQAANNGRIAYYRIIFEKTFSSPIDDFSLLQGYPSYIAHSFWQIEDEIKYNRENNNYWLLKFAQDNNSMKNKSNILCYPYWDNQSHTILKGIAKISWIGKCNPLVDYEIPQMVRTIDFNLITYSYKWVVMTPFRKLIKTQKTCKGIEHLPQMGQTVAMTIDRWVEGVGEKEWNDEYCKKVIERNKEEEEQSKQGFLSVSPIKQWLEKHDEKELFYAKVNDLFEKFKEIIDDQKSTKRNIKKELCCLVKEINKLQTEEHFFETSEREEIISYLSFLLSSRDCIGYIDEIDNIREW